MVDREAGIIIMFKKEAEHPLLDFCWEDLYAKLCRKELEDVKWNCKKRSKLYWCVFFKRTTVSVFTG
jgi:hypothetical protein